MDVAEAVESLAAHFLGRHGIVSVSDAYQEDGTPFLLVLSTSPSETRESELPETHHGFRVLVQRSEPLRAL